MFNQVVIQPCKQYKQTLFPDYFHHAIKLICFITKQKYSSNMRLLQLQHEQRTGQDYVNKQHNRHRNVTLTY